MFLAIFGIASVDPHSISDHFDHYANLAAGRNQGALLCT